MLKEFSATLFSFCLMAFSASLAQENLNDSLKTYNLKEDVVVTATRLSTPEKEVASSVTILGEKEILNSSKNSLIDLLRNVPGLSVSRQGGPGTNANVYMRGANTNHTLVLLDGVVMNDPSSVTNAFDFTNLQTDNIQRIEVLRGPQSTLYGSDAIAGVISIFTKKGDGSLKVNLLTEAGSFNTFRENGTLNGSSSIFDYSVSYSRLDSKGFSSANEKYGNTEKDGTYNNSLLSRLGINFTKNLNLDINYNFIKSKADLDQNSKNGDDPNFTSKTEESVFKAALNAKFFNGLWQPTVGFSSLRHINHTVDDADQLHNYSSVADFDGLRYKLEWLNNLYVNGNNTLSFGIDNSVEKASTYYYSDQFGPYASYFPNAGSAEPKAITTGIFLQEQFAYSGRYFGSMGIRYDKHNKFGSEFTYRLAPAYFITETDTKLKATYGTGFKSPSLYYLFDPSYGNPNLKAERSKGWDAGIEQYLFNNRLILGATYFDNKFTNLIGMDSNFRTINIDSAETKGVELSLKTTPLDGLITSFSYTYTSSKNTTSNKPSSGTELLRRPANQLNLDIDYSIHDLDLNLEVANTGKRYDNEYDPVTFTLKGRVKLDSYTLVNLSASYQVTKYLKIFGRIDNLLNEDYEEVLFYGTPKRSAYAGIRINY
ncbi:MAG: TonB-dependent receptor [Bacteroidota bacterium]|nr:TonB-dependent receptor [Bacteroidota bacterium]MDP4191513.1 TonB-dependent receptor [Bacteroidota bacterium]